MTRQKATLSLSVLRFLSAAAIVSMTSAVSFGALTSISLTAPALGLGGDKINADGNGDPVEADRPGQLVTSTAANIGSVLFVQRDNTAGPGVPGNPLLATITARSHLDIVDDLPPGAEIHAGVITLTDGSKALKDEGLGVRAFGLDVNQASPNYGKRYVNPAYLNVDNETGFQMEGSKEVSGGVDFTSWMDFIDGHDDPPGNDPPHVDEDVKFDINDAELNIPANSIRVLLTKIKAGGKGDDDMVLAVDLTINLVGGGQIFNSYGFISDAPDVFTQPEDGVIQIDFSGASLGLTFQDEIDSFVIGARDDPVDPEAPTDEHFLINGFSFIPEPTTLSLALVLMGVAACRRRRV